MKLAVFSIFILILNGCAAYQPVTQSDIDKADWGVYPYKYKEIVSQWIHDNRPHENRNVEISTPEKWWVRNSRFSGGNTIFGYRVMFLPKPSDGNGVLDGDESRSLFIRNGVIIRDWEDIDEISTVGGDTDEIQIYDVRVGSIVSEKSERVESSWQIIAKINVDGAFIVTVTTPFDKSLSTTFDCIGPGEFSGFFFARREFPSIWEINKGPRSFIFPFKFSFRDKFSNKQFEIIKWKKLTSSEFYAAKVLEDIRQKEYDLRQKKKNKKVL